MSVFKLEKPVYSGIGIDIIPNLLRLLEQSEDIRNLINKINHPKYLYWDKVKYLPHPDNISVEELWFLAKHLRKRTLDRSDAVIKAEDGTNFSWRSLPQMEEVLHEIDLTFSDGPSPIPDEDKYFRKEYELRKLREEALATSQLEGAVTTDVDGIQLLLKQNKALNKSDQMVLNSYNSLMRLKEEFMDSDLDIDLLFEMHKTIVRGTVKNEQLDRFRKEKDGIYVWDRSEQIIYHIPPDENFLNQEIPRFIDYANDKLKDHRFVHPVIKAIVLHFWLAYLHPFTDGNGRLARLLFNWYLLRNGYWIFPYQPLSRLIKNSAIQYRNAYIYSEQDEYDLTYFIDYILRKIRQAKIELVRDVEEVISEYYTISSKLGHKYGINNRQIRVLSYFQKNKKNSTTYKAHSKNNKITRLTAMKDLRGLEKLGFLTSKKIGREIHFYATDKISELV